MNNMHETPTIADARTNACSSPQRIPNPNGGQCNDSEFEHLPIDSKHPSTLHTKAIAYSQPAERTTPLNCVDADQA
jgi:hypothetical protein